MIKNMKLSTKIATGFTIVVAIAALLGFMGWYGLSAVMQKIEVVRETEETVEAMNDCAALRRDFSIHGKAELKNGKSADQLWSEAYNEMESGLEELGASR